MEEAAKTAKQSAESVSKGGEKLGKTAAFRALSQVGQASRPGCPGLPWPALNPGARAPNSHRPGSGSPCPRHRVCAPLEAGQPWASEIL